MAGYPSKEPRPRFVDPTPDGPRRAEPASDPSGTQGNTQAKPTSTLDSTVNPDVVRAPGGTVIIKRGAVPGPQSTGPLSSGARAVLVFSNDLAVEVPPGRPGEQFVIGRDQSCCALVIRDAKVSRVHAAIRADSDGVWIVDRGSSNGTFLNGVRVQNSAKLSDGDAVRVGATEFRVRC